MTVFELDETAQEELDRTGSLCSQCLRDSVLQLIDLYDNGDVTGWGAIERLRVLAGKS
jgi:hypothetical protein